ncbi:MAG: bifunctional oligoribonuclease/PAP phosphatase NrnA [Armatimonadetes bacterium]|nr:bifunctional oligoribonuclease/PAP phosphatase NrnA [Candidatus Hippobium faecium]
MDYKNFWQSVTKHNNILIGIHPNPDGDCIGGALALQTVFEKLNIKTTVYSADPIPDCVSFLNTEKITDTLKDRHFQLLLMVDVNSPDRTKISQERVPKKKFIIDHHEKADTEYDTELIDTKSSSVCEIIYNLFTENNIEITEYIATCLLTGIICDTGGFIHSNTTGNVLRTAGDLTDRGANPHFITEKYFREKDYSVIKMTGYVLNSLETYDEGKIIFAFLDNKYLRDNSIENIDSDPVNQFIQSVKGQKVTAFLRETDENKVRISLRSSGNINCNSICMTFGGGGHINASGCTIRKSLTEAKQDLLEAIRKEMK